MNGRQLITRAKELMKFQNTDYSTDTGRPTNTVILNALNEERRVMYADLAVTLKQRFATTTTLTYTADAESMSLPAGVVDNPILKVAFVTGSDTVKQPLLAVLVTEAHNYPDKGVPRRYAILDDKIYLFPKPSVDATVTFWYDPSVTDIANDTNSPTELKDLFHHVIAYGAALRLRAPNQDPDMQVQRVYDRDYAKMLAYYESLVHDHGIHEEEDNYYG